MHISQHGTTLRWYVPFRMCSLLHSVLHAYKWSSMLKAAVFMKTRILLCTLVTCICTVMISLHQHFSFKEPYWPSAMCQKGSYIRMFVGKQMASWQHHLTSNISACNFTRATFAPLHTIVMQGCFTMLNTWKEIEKDCSKCTNFRALPRLNPQINHMKILNQIWVTQPTWTH